MALLSGRKKCYCAFCKSERLVYAKKRISFINVMAAAVASLVTMMVIWSGPEPRAFLFFIAYLALAEGFVQIRWRLCIVCKHCGFDPVLYLKEPARAAEKVRLTLEVRKNDPASLLRTPLKIPFLRKKPDPGQKMGSAVAVAKASGRLVSKQI